MRGPSDRASLRWSGLLLGVAGIALLVSIALYGLVFGEVTAADPEQGITLADRAAHLRSTWGPLAAIWTVETVGYLFVSVASLVRLGEGRLGESAVPVDLAWAAVAVGGFLQTAMYAFMLGGYPPSALAAEAHPAVLGAMDGAANFLFNVSTAGILLGLGLVYLAEGGAHGVLSRAGGRVGAAILLVGFVALLAHTAGLVSLVAIAPFGLAVQVLMGWLGLRLWQRGASPRLVRPAADTH